ncbi:MAG: zf-HC2 domain-containing protein [candidate division Zixibacteria bacterium]|nr:zf-HC2 domain-containing protein [candidate division Zixibacteria bacterium]
MDHGYYHDRISAYHDRELPPYEEQAMREHLEQCEKCRDLLAQLDKLDVVVEEHSRLSDDEYWEQSVRRIQERVEADSRDEKTSTEKSSDWFGLSWKITAAAASIAVLTFIGLHQTDIYGPDKDGFIYKPSIETLSDKKGPGTNEPPTAIEDGADDIGRSDEVADQVPETKTPQEETIQRSAPKKAEESESQPATVDELLTEVSGVVTNSQGEVFIRGGRAAEVSYVVDGVPVADPQRGLDDPQRRLDDPPGGRDQAEDQSKQEKSPVVEDRADQLAPSKIGEASTPSVEVGASQKTIAREKATRPATAAGLETQTAVPMNLDSDAETTDKSVASKGTFDDVDELDLEGWILRRDSLEARWKDLDQKERSLTFSLNSQTKSLDRARGVERKLLESHYNVARLARGQDQETFDKAVDSLQEYLNRDGSRHPRMARDYLRRLGIDPK